MLLSGFSREWSTRDSKMRENGSVHDKIIDRNWVLKRKRKRLPSGSDLSNGKEGISVLSDSPRNNTSAKRRLKDDFNLSRSAHKKKGNDGYYFECVICDLGGNLLCCDSCPRTYHLQCLNPPLKRTPPGKWQCPSCCEQKESIKSINHPDSISRRARTRVAVEKPKDGIKSPRFDKLSLIVRSTIPGKNRSSSKGKRAFTRTGSSGKKPDSSQMGVTCGIKATHRSDGGPTEGIPIRGDIDIEKKLSVSGADASPDRKTSPSCKEVDTPFKTLESDLIGGPSETKSDFPCSNGFARNKLIPPSDQSNKKARKKRQKTDKGENQKKSRADKGKYGVTTFFKRRSKASSTSPKITGLRQKRSSVEQMSVSISKEDVGVQTLAFREQDEGFTEEASHSSHGLDEPRVKVDKTFTCEENVADEIQQVDRILGCRLQSSDVNFSAHIQPTKFATSPANADSKNNFSRFATALSSNDLHIPEIDEGLSEDLPAGSRAADVNIGENIPEEGCHITMNDLDKGKCIDTDTGIDKLNTDETLLIKECIGEAAAMSSTRKSLKDQGLTAIKDKVEEFALSAVDSGELTGKMVPENNTDIPFVNLDINRTCSVPDSCDSRHVDDELLETRPSSTPENKIQETARKQSTPTDQKNALYEYLVKWVGQSHLHNSWVSEHQLKILAKRKLENYKAKYGTGEINICQEQWSQPQRVIALRDSKDGTNEALVKWCCLPYDECTWEKLNEHVIENSAHLIAEFKEFERQTFEKDNTGADLLRTKGDHQQNEVIYLVEQPKELKGGSLFPHQLEALNWLRKCWHKSKNVILADEMGLGKTISACAFLSSLYIEFKARLPCLVLVPLSTMPNWLAEFALWAPHLNVVEYHGCAKARSIIRQYEWHATDKHRLQRTTSYKFNVLLTTYEMVLADSSHLRCVPWEVLVVDEGHRLKNSGSKLFGLLNTFSFQHRVLLTGTPMQNNIGELYNLLNFLQPLSFSSLSAFEEKFNDLTTTEKVEELKKLVSPHMLRRLKKDAMQNIPPKIERMVPVELSSIQAEYYRAMLTKNYQILRNIGKGVPQQSMLNIVMQLRKVCNHPYLIPGTEPDSGSVEFLQEMRIKASAKLTLLHSMLKVLNKEGHRVLIFSQMTKLLDILEDYLTIEFGPKTFERVDGSVSVADRQASIARFNQDRARFVFLLSTRSCGLGINLATADTVIIYDSDFNPHADIQAMNRAHRIGQSNRLLVYRLVVRASVEERILQLARKKLMLDQLFVNKSESQKEVEDILRWGTEELFSDCADVSEKDPDGNSKRKTEVAVDMEHKQRRGGGLGDVYKDKCTDGCTKIVWDDNAVLRLLDRSNLQLGSSESTEGDMENDVLGSVKAVEWDDEPTEEQGVSEMLPSVAGDVCAQSSEKKVDPMITSTEENEWDRLLRMRWEKYQSEEEAALGRGKRLRKAVSYKEAFPLQPSDAPRESGNEEEDPEQQPEYTPAGRALKQKFAKLRARQKERLAQRHTTEGSPSIEHQLRPESQPHFPSTPIREGEGLEFIRSIGCRRDQAVINLQDNRITQPLNAPRNRRDSISKPGRSSRHSYKSFQSSYLDLSVRPPGTLTPNMFLPSHQFQSTSLRPSVPPNNLLPVLGLCAPTANQIDSTPRNFQSYPNLPRSSCEQRRTATGVSEFPFRIAPGTEHSSDIDFKGREHLADTSTLTDASLEILHRRLKNTFQDSSFPFSPCPPTTSQGKGPDPLERSSTVFSAFQEKMELPNLVIDEKLQPKFSLPAKNISKSHPDLLPGLSLGMKGETSNEYVKDLPAMPLLPNFRFQMNDNLKQNRHARGISPMLGLGQVEGTYSSLPENHKKVLDNIMMRTGSGMNNLLTKRLKVDGWTEDELDALWIGVRRHGRGNWDAMLRDTKLKFSKYKTAQDLSARWEQEQLKVLDGQASVTPKSSNSTSFVGISDGMMTRALLGSRLNDLASDHRVPPRFRTHLTDIQLGYGDLTSGPPCAEPAEHFGLKNEHCAPVPAWKSDKFTSSFNGKAGPSDKPRSSHLPLDLEQPFIPDSLQGNSLGSLNLNCSSGSDLQGKEGEQCSSKYLKLPSLLDKSLNWLRDFHNNIRSGESGTGILPDPNQRSGSSHSSMKDDIAGSSSTMSKLPHWLREAVSVPAKQPEPNFPPTVSAIAHSVRLLYGEDKPAIPPFTALGPPPFQPMDPRRNLKKKKRKLRKLRRMRDDIFTSSKSFQTNTLGDSIASSSIPLPPPFPMLPLSAPYSLGPPWIDSSLPSLNLNLMNSPSSSSLFETHRKKSSMTLSPSPEVLNLVASCVAPGPNILPDGMPSSSCVRNELPVVKDFNPLESTGKSPDLKGARGKRKARRSSLLGSWGQLPEDRVDRTESGDSSKTHSDPCRADCPELKEISSEETVSDNHPSEHE
ncbi:protein CHROMATIN REMODELING 4-like isoform X2 [Tasmannia lanceolata]|uniref:protein CHROMATIN REMODELING 4-like isoform X2 n=1 Tax=Tasmannia lanceolata TaxID=3420 RepID=UPI0040648CF8